MSLMTHDHARRADLAVAASAVRAQRVTDDDSNWLLGKSVNEIAVAIRKARRLANGYRSAPGFFWGTLPRHPGEHRATYGKGGTWSTRRKAAPAEGDGY